MTTHQELFDAFLHGEQQPRRASNMEIMWGENNINAALVSGRGTGGAAEEYPGAVIAVRKPLEQFVLPEQQRHFRRWGEVTTRSRTIHDHYSNIRHFLRGRVPGDFLHDVAEINGEEMPTAPDLDFLNNE